MSKAVTLGEIMMRLSTPRNERFIQAKNFEINFGGGEANVAVSLASFGHDAEFITKLPENPLGDSVIASLRKMNVQTNRIVRGGKRLGVYYLETGSSVRPSNVVYDRADSSFAQADKDEFDFDSVLKDADLFHISGITPAVSENAAEIALAALEAAKRNNVKVSFDINYRSKLWTVDEAAQVLTKLAPYADIFFGNAWDAKNLLKLDIDETADFETASKALSDAFGFEYVLASKRVCHSASNNDFSAGVYSAKDNACHRTRTYSITPIVDRVGTGDSFAAGFLCGILDGKNYADAVEFAAASAVLCHTISGDFNCITKKEAEALAGGDASGNVRR